MYCTQWEGEIGELKGHFNTLQILLFGILVVVFCDHLMVMSS